MQMETEMDLAIDEILRKAPTVPRRNPNRRLYSKSLPPLYSKPLPPLPAEVFQIAKELIPAPLFSRRNTLTDAPLNLAPAITTTTATITITTTTTTTTTPTPTPTPTTIQDEFPSPILLPLPTSSATTSPKSSFHFSPSSPTISFRSSPPSSSHSSNPSPSSFIRSVSSPSSSHYSFQSKTSTPATSPPTSPPPLMRSLVCTTCSKICPPILTTPIEPDPEIIPSRPRMMPPSPKKSLKRKTSPRKDTLRSLRAKESEALLQKNFKQKTGMYLDGLVLEMENLLEGWEDEDEEDSDDHEE